MSNRSVALVAAADAAYFPFLDGLLASLESAPLPAQVSRCVMDLGLSAEQIAARRQRVDRILSAGWAIDFPERSTAPSWFRAMVNRPFLPELFPGFDVYLWLDVDGWTQTPECLAKFIDSTDGGAIAIVPERFGPPIKYATPLPHGRVFVEEIDERSIRAHMAACYRDCFGEQYAGYAEKPVRNIGAFAMRGDSPIWSVWQDYLRIGLRNGFRHALVEQSAMNAAILEGKAAACDLPFTCNWNLSTNHPLLDQRRRALVDPIDSSVIGFVHLNDAKKFPGLRLRTTAGTLADVPLGFRQFAAVYRGRK